MYNLYNPVEDACLNTSTSDLLSCISGVSRFTHCPWWPVRRPWGFLWHSELKWRAQEVSTDERKWRKSLRLAPGLATGKAEWTGLTPDEPHSGKGGGKCARDNVNVSNVMLRLRGKVVPEARGGQLLECGWPCSQLLIVTPKPVRFVICTSAEELKMHENKACRDTLQKVIHPGNCYWPSGDKGTKREPYTFV